MTDKKYNPPETAPTDRRILVRTESGAWFAATWMQHISSDSVMWVIVRMENGDCHGFETITGWVELPEECK